MSPFDGIPDYGSDDVYLHELDSQALGLKTPPHSIEAEQAVIGGLLISPAAFDVICDLVGETDFYRNEHRVIFAAIAKLAEAAKPHDVITVNDALTAGGLAEQSGGIAYLFELANNTASAANVRAYANVIREKAILRALIASAATIADAAYQPHGRSAAELLDEAQAALISLGDSGGSDNDLGLSTTLKEYVHELQRRFDADGCVGLPTGFTGIDTRMCGLQGGDLVIIGGRPKSGKTTLAMNIAENVAVKQGKPVLVFSMEMSRLNLIDRMVASNGSIPFASLRNGQAVGHEEHGKQIGISMTAIKNSPLFIDDRPALTVAQMRGAARRQHRKTPLSLIVVDYLQLARAKAENRVMEITLISQGLKALAKELNCPVIALSQLSRKCEEQKRRPMASDLRDSGSIEQDADAILLIYRDEVYNEDSHMKGTAEVIIPALRNGEAGVEYLDSNLAVCRFENKKNQYRPPDPPQQNKRRGGNRGYD